jgi:hypothetical protein
LDLLITQSRLGASNGNNPNLAGESISKLAATLLGQEHPTAARGRIAGLEAGVPLAPQVIRPGWRIRGLRLGASWRNYCIV